MWGGVILFGIVPTIIYIGIGLYILSLEHIKKRAGYKLPALIYFISVPSLIVIAITLSFFMNYSTGKFESSHGAKPAGYEVYKFLVLKDIIPRSGQSLDEETTTENIKVTQKPTQTVKKVQFNEDILKDKTKLNFKESGPFYGIKENGRMVRGILKGFQNQGFKTDFYGLFTKNQLYWKGYSEIKYDDGRVLYQYNEYKLDENGKVIIDKDGIYQLVDSYLISEEDFEKVRKYITYDIAIPFDLYDFEETKTNIAKKKTEESIKNENQTELIKNQIDKNKDYEDIVGDLKIDENFTTILDKKDEFEDISVEIEKKVSERKLNNGENIDTIIHQTSYSHSDKYSQLKYSKITNINYPSYLIYNFNVAAGVGENTSAYFKDISKDFKLYSDYNNSKYLFLKWNSSYEDSLLYVGTNKPIENFEIEFKQDLQHLKDKVDNNEITNKEAKKIAVDKFTKEYLNYFSFTDNNLTYSLTPEEKENFDVIGKYPEIVNYDPNRSNKFQGLCATPEKYNNFFKNNYKDTNCEEIYLEKINDIEIEFVNRIENLQVRLEAKLKEPILKPFKTDEKYYALVIGNNNYEYLEKLDAAENDAEVIADVLTNKYGFEVDLLLNADYEKTVDTLFQITNKLKRNDNLLIYYAGHGELDKAENRGYWLPVDASYEQRSKWISNQRIVDRIKATKAKHVLLIADSCFSGTLMRSGITPEDNEAIDEKYIERLKSKKTRLVITSGGNEPVVDSDGGDHSLFALKLIDTLKNNNTVINSQMLFENIRRYVVSNADQTPERAMVHKTGHDGGDFLFFPKN